MESGFNYAYQVVNTASRWELQWSWPRMTWAKAQALRAWLDSLRGQVGTFRYYPRGLVSAAPVGITLATAGSAYVNTISAGGFTANGATNLLTGQYFSLGEQLFRITAAPVTADPNGLATVSFEPDMRTAFAAGTSVNFTRPSVLMRLVASDGLGFTLDPDKRPDLGTISAREAIG